MTDAEVRDYFQDLYRLGSDPSASLEEKIEQAITIGRDRLDVDYGILSYTGSGDYEVIGSTIQSGQYAAGSTHDLRNPLTGARGYTELAAESVSGPESDYLQTALDSLERMETLITETLTLAKEGADVGERESVQLSSVARAAWETVSPTTATLEISNDLTVQADRSRLRQLFENLFRNAAEHCDAGVVVTVEGTQDGFAVEDTGPGLPVEIAESLFGGTYGTGRRGLGLLIVERVVSGHGWNGSVESDETRTRFEFSGVSAVTDPPRVAD